MPLFGQIVIGPPGCGKTTYCFAMKEYFEHFKRETIIINLDPANETERKFDIDIRDLINLDDVGKNLHLGPNSSFLYCFEFLDKNIGWLNDKIISYGKKYFIIDTPGQIEIFTLSKSFKNIINFLLGKDIRLCCVNLIESSNLCDMPRYIFSILSVLNAMINLSLPQVNLLSKIDLLKDFLGGGSTPLPLSFLKNPNDYEMLNEMLEQSNLNPKLKTLDKKLSEFVIDYGLISFDILDIRNQKHLNRAATLIDSANGYIYCSTGEDEEYIEVRNEIARNDSRFHMEEDDEEYEGV